MTTGLPGPYDLVAAIVMTILAGLLVWVSAYAPAWLGWCLRILAALSLPVRRGPVSGKGSECEGRRTHPPLRIEYFRSAKH
jgi:hypothetical protein